MRKRYIVGAVVAFLVIMVAVGAGLYGLRQQAIIIPAPVKKQLGSTLLLPDEATAIVEKSSVKYDTSLQLLTFNVTMEGAVLVMSEQPTPESFVDVPQAYDKVVSGMNEYSKFDTDGGTVHLTRPKNLAGKQAAVLNAKGTLLFVKPSQDLTDRQWRQFFTSLAVHK